MGAGKIQKWSIDISIGSQKDKAIHGWESITCKISVGWSIGEEYTEWVEVYSALFHATTPSPNQVAWLSVLFLIIFRAFVNKNLLGSFGPQLMGLRVFPWSRSSVGTLPYFWIFRENLCHSTDPLFSNLGLQKMVLKTWPIKRHVLVFSKNTDPP